MGGGGEGMGVTYVTIEQYRNVQNQNRKKKDCKYVDFVGHLRDNFRNVRVRTYVHIRVDIKVFVTPKN